MDIPEEMKKSAGGLGMRRSSGATLADFHSMIVHQKGEARKESSLSPK